MSKTQSFKVMQLGSVPVASHNSEGVSQEAMNALSSITKTKKVVLTVHEDYISVSSAKNSDIIHRTPTCQITYAAMNFEKGIVAYIEARENAMTGDWEHQKCYAFFVKTNIKDVYTSIMKTYNLTASSSVTKRTVRRPKVGGQASVSKDSPLAVFEARYLGSVPVTQKKGDAVVEQALQYLRAQLDPSQMRSATTGNSVALVISKEGIRTLDSLTRAVIHNIFIRNISFATVVEEGNAQEVFGCISFDDRLERSCCYVYNCVAGQAPQICQQIGKASNASCEEQESNVNPFEVTPSETQHTPALEQQPSLMKKHLPREQLAAVKPIGVGQFGKVYLATLSAGKEQEKSDQEDMEQLAVKMLRNTASNNDRAEFLKEATRMIDFDHENVLRLVGVSLLEEPWLLVVEFAQYGDLHNVLLACKEKAFKMNFTEQLLLTKQLAAGMAYIAEQEFIHMDLAARNILLGTNNMVKISDFGIAKKYDPGTKRYVLKDRLKLSLRWLAVETFTSDPKSFSEKSDVWAFGVVLWEVMNYGATPYGKLRLNEVHRLVPKGLRLQQPQGCSDEFFKFMLLCWATNPDERKTFTQLEADLKEMYDKESDTTPARDIGSCLNESLSNKLRRLSHKAVTMRKQGSTSSSSSAMLSTVIEGNISRSNPLFDQDFFFDPEDTIDEEGEESDELAHFATPNVAPPTGSYVVGDKNGDVKPKVEKLDITKINLGGDNSYLNGKTSPMGMRKASVDKLGMRGNFLPTFPNSQPPCRAVVILPKEVKEEEASPADAELKKDRLEMLSKNPSKTSLQIDPDMFVPNE